MNKRWRILCCILGVGIVIGGLVSSTLLTLIAIPVFYEWATTKTEIVRAS
jgi:Cu/Ag efflux pump CusA